MRSQKGFTLIELLIVVVIIGILAAIAIPKFSNTREKAYVAAMKSDIRNLVTAQESYFADNTNTYATDVASFGTAFTPSTGVTITISDVTATGWSATAAHGSTSQVCSVTLGGSATNSGEPVCGVPD